MLRQKLIAFILLMSANLFAVENHSREPLFVIERSTNANVVHYDAKITEDGGLDPRQPVVAYWVMAAEDGRRQELSALEKMKAYGFTIERGETAGSYRLALVAQKHRDIYVHRQEDAIRAETLIAGHRAYLSKIYVSTHNTLLLPTADYVELYGTDITTGDNLYEKLLPGSRRGNAFLSNK